MPSNDFLISIARAKLGPLRHRLAEKWGITELVFDDEEKSLAAIVGKVDRASGGRGVLNALSEFLIDPLAAFLFMEVDPPDDGEERTLRVSQFHDHAQFGFELA